MNKEVFLHQLRIRLSQLGEAEVQKRLDYYDELIEDMKDDGISEEEAVNSFGDVDSLAAQIIQEAPLSALVKSKVKPKHGWTSATVFLAILGAPLWIPLLFAFVCVIASVFLVIWAAILCIFAVVLAIGLSGVFLLFKGFHLIGAIGVPYILFTFGCGLALIGICLLAFLLAKILSFALIDLTRWVFRQVKSLFIKKEAV